MAQPISSEEFRKRAKRLLEAFVYDYLRKSGCTDTARTYFEEVGLDNWPPEWLINVIRNEIITKKQENEVIKERKKKVQMHHRGNKGEHANDDDGNKKEENEEHIEVNTGESQKENNEEIRKDTNFKDVEEHVEDGTATGDATRHNYHCSNEFMKSTSTDTTLLPPFNAFSNNELPSIPLPLDVPGGFLNEWWLTFWDLFSNLQERNSRISYGNSFE
ncbi:unnamed protein product [Rhizophagus irregularis]|uniref:Uncharacterized protein n=1 Tax=Rhizophagus irregularis TaxID=588596 RepID=A0A2N1NT30_9GLOM|nr:hypothetical protein RhiirC2_844682 [Rhizophagus irregularis]CAB4388976.1 unnamed protein product [Rhizophagus irregularis]CAB5384763.1 unnamed protein product [Rhizophagus irregularis]